MTILLKRGCTEAKPDGRGSTMCRAGIVIVLLGAVLTISGKDQSCVICTLPYCHMSAEVQYSLNLLNKLALASCREKQVGCTSSAGVCNVDPVFLLPT